MIAKHSNTGGFLYYWKLLSCQTIAMQLFISTLLVLTLSALIVDGKMYSLKLRRTEEYSYEEVIMGEQIISQRGDLKGNPGNGYSVDIDIGTPKQRLNVLVDTGSSNFAIAAAPNPILTTYFKFNESSTYKSLNKDIDVRYTVGSWSGVLGKDVMRLPDGPDVRFSGNIASILESDQFFINGSYWQGILGLGYAAIARPDSSVEPFFDSLVNQTDIPNIFTMQLCGIDEDAPKEENKTKLITGGTMTIGGIDDTLYKGKIFYTPLREKWFYEVVITNIKIDNQSLGMDCKEYNFDKTFVDSGTTKLRLPVRVFNEVVETIKERVSPEFLKGDEIPENFWSGGTLLCREKFLGTNIWDHFPSLTMSLAGMNAGEEFELLIPAKQYLRLVESKDEEDGCYKFGIAISESGTVIGVTAMEGFYVVFDRQNEKIGFAISSCAKTQCFDKPACTLEAPNILGIQNTDASDCGFDRGSGRASAMEIVGYIMLTICILCFTPVVIMYIHLKCQRYCQSEADYTRQHNELSSTELEEEED
ncbi:beta-secretase 1-like [Apostichopus japonicus]|uniref:beta-secretase 1-like n=1 Tax=Stichopus japonicus TaxID=307972 RepID=UPI003AB31A34